MRAPLLLFALLLPPAAPGGTPPADYPVTPVPFTAVEFTDGFWSRRIDVNRNVTLPHNFVECENTGRIDNFVFAAGLKQGKHTGYQFNDSDIYKVIEGASYSLLAHPDTDLVRTIDSIIVFIAAAQEPDGYLYTPRRLITPDYAPPGGKERWVGMKDGSHELYTVGHLYEAAAAHFAATGKRSLLTVALRSADLVCSTFGPGLRGEVPDHQEIEIGLCTLYRVTGDEKYLRTAKWFLDQRGNAQGHELLGEYAQDDRPILDQEGAEGHAVRAAYMYSAMADVTALGGDDTYLPALERIWRDVVNRKLYVTGGIGAVGRSEGFSQAYTLPNFSAYCETCASIALALWSQRMFLLKGDAQYIDVLERVMYNAILSGVSMNGDTFFYPNPLGSYRGAERSSWFACACCPPNVLRFIAGVGGYAYAQRAGDLYVNLFASGRGTIERPGGALTVRQETRYPWDGDVRITLEPARPGEFTVYVRIPGWAVHRPVPGTLYSVLGPMPGSVPGRRVGPAAADITLRVDGTPVPLVLKNGYAVIRRKWKTGDFISLALPMPVQRIIANDSLEDDRGKTALERGPLVYCLEGIDARDGHVTDLVIPDSAAITHEFRGDMLNGITILHGRGYTAERTLGGEVVAGEEREFRAVPYYAWAHRGKCEMTVWPARTLASALPLPAPTLARRSSVSASHDIAAYAVNDQILPKNSSDESTPRIHWWPRKGTTEWVQYDFPGAQSVSRAEVYWFDDTGEGECRVPKSWRILYREGDRWIPVANTVPYVIEKDRSTPVSFEAVRTASLRIEIDLQAGFSAGIYEWKVE
jgi:DUF1680 family protein